MRKGHDERHTYSIKMDVRFNPLELIDVNAIVEECDKKWFNQTLTKVNDCVVRLGIPSGSGFSKSRAPGAAATNVRNTKYGAIHRA
jgi:hypothetical protein